MQQVEVGNLEVDGVWSFFWRIIQLQKTQFLSCTFQKEQLDIQLKIFGGIPISTSSPIDSPYPNQLVISSRRMDRRPSDMKFW